MNTASVLVMRMRRATSVDSRGMLAASSVAPSAGATGRASVLPAVRTLPRGLGAAPMGG